MLFISTVSLLQGWSPSTPPHEGEADLKGWWVILKVDDHREEKRGDKVGQGDNDWREVLVDEVHHEVLLQEKKNQISSSSLTPPGGRTLITRPSMLVWLPLYYSPVPAGRWWWLRKCCRSKQPGQRWQRGWGGGGWGKSDISLCACDPLFSAWSSPPPNPSGENMTFENEACQHWIWILARKT